MPREPGPWLATIARNECLLRIRSRMREPLPAVEHEPPDVRADVHQAAVGRLNARQLWREIDRLPAQQRDAVILRELAGLSYGELALTLGLSEPAVESLLFRARERLRTRLRPVLAALDLAGLASAAARFLANAAPTVVAKAAAVGVGVAVVGGSAVVGEKRFLSQSHHRHPVAARVRRPKATPPVVRTISQVRPPTPHVVLASAVASRHDDDRDERVRVSPVAHDDDNNNDNSNRGDDGDGPRTAPKPEPRETETETGTPRPRPAVTTTARDGGDDDSTRTTTTTASSDGGDGGDSGDDAGASLTVTLPTIATPAVTISDGGSGPD